MEANLNNLRISPRKVSVVAKMLAGLSVREADVQLDRQLRRAALPLRKLLASAIANAEHNFRAIPENLIVARVLVGEGKKLKRWMPRAQGRATPIWKRLSRVSLTLREVEPGKRLKSSAVRKKFSKTEKRRRENPSKIGGFPGSGSVGASKKSVSVRSSSSLFHRKSV